MNGENGTLLVRPGLRDGGRFRVHVDGALLGPARNNVRTPFVLAPGTHRVQVRGGWPLRTNTVDVDVPAGGRVQVDVGSTWAFMAPMVLAPLYLTTHRLLWSLAAMVLVTAVVWGVPGVFLRLRTVRL